MKMFYGGEADVIKISNSKVIKLFRKSEGNHPQLCKKCENLWIHSIFQDQIKAYELISNSEFSYLIPYFFGIKDATKFTFDLQSNKYLLKCNYVLEYLPGNPMKFAFLKKKKRNEYKEAFSSIGVNYLEDASIIDGKLIDFGTNNPNNSEIELINSCILKK